MDNINWVDISKEMKKIDGWKKREDISNLNFIDLFAGAGGLSCGLVMAGFNPVSSVEIMQCAVDTYKYNFIEKKGFNEFIESRDICLKETKNNLYKQIGNKHIHLIAGGFPCQGFSMAGLRIVEDKRNSLYKEMLEIVSVVQPDFILMENVPGLRSMLNGKIEEKIITDYSRIGYNINVAILNAADYGVPQLRKRVIFIGNRIGKINYHPKPIYLPNQYKNVMETISHFSNLKEDKTINHIFTKHSKEIVKQLSLLKEGESLYKNYSDAWKRVYSNKPSPTVKENHGGVNVHPIYNRVMTPRELAALQSFPDDFIFKGSKKWQLVQIGNAVPPLLGKAVGLAIHKSMEVINNNEYTRNTLF